MRFLAIVGTLIVALGAYTGLWFWTAHRLETGIEQWAAAEREKGAIVDYQALEITGFPYRMRAELTEPAVARPTEGGMAMWATPMLVIDSYPYKINHLIFDFPAPIFYDRPLGDKPHNKNWREQTEFRFEEAHASVVLTLSGARASFEAKGITARARFAEDGQEPEPFAPLLTADTVNAHLRPAPGRDNVYEGYADAAALTVLRANPRTKQLPPPVSRFEAQFYVTEAQSVTQALLDGADPAALLKGWAGQGGELEIERFYVNVKGTELTASGALAVDEDGYAQGPLKFKAVGWQKSDVLINPGGTLPADKQEMAKGIYELFDQLDGKLDGTMQTELLLMRGGAWLGPFRLITVGKVW